MCIKLHRGELKPERLGLTLEEAKGTMEGVQRILAARQVEEYVDAQRRCPAFARQRTQKGLHEILYRTLFGRLGMESPRLYEFAGHRRAAADPATAGEGSSGWQRYDYATPFDSDSAIRAWVGRIHGANIRCHWIKVGPRLSFAFGESFHHCLPISICTMYSTYGWTSGARSAREAMSLSSAMRMTMCSGPSIGLKQIAFWRTSLNGWRSSVWNCTQTKRAGLSSGSLPNNAGNNEEKVNPRRPIFSASRI